MPIFAQMNGIAVIMGKVAGVKNQTVPLPNRSYHEEMLALEPMI
jgi:hypothetical protein